MLVASINIVYYFSAKCSAVNPDNSPQSIQTIVLGEGTQYISPVPTYNPNLSAQGVDPTATATFSCNAGYASENNQLTCSDAGVWTGTLSACTGKNN